MGATKHGKLRAYNQKTLVMNKYILMYLQPSRYTSSEKKCKFCRIYVSDPAVVHLHHWSPSPRYPQTLFPAGTALLTLLWDMWLNLWTNTGRERLLISSGQFSLWMYVLWQEFLSWICSSATLGRGDHGDRSFGTHMHTQTQEKAFP